MNVWVPATCGSSVLGAQVCSDPKPAFQTSVLAKGSRSYDYSSFAIIRFRKKVKSLSRVPTLCDPVGCSLPSSSVYGILQARILEWVAISNPWIEPGFPALEADTLTSEPPGKPKPQSTPKSSPSLCTFLSEGWSGEGWGPGLLVLMAL